MGILTWKNRVKLVSDWLEKWTIVFSLISTSVLVINLFVAVLFRYFFDNPLYWADELSLYLFSWMTFLGGSLAVKRKQHPAVSLGIPKTLIIYTVILIFSIVVLYFSIGWITSESILIQYSTTLPMPLWVPYSILPVSMFLIAFFSLEQLLHGLGMVQANKIDHEERS